MAITIIVKDDDGNQAEIRVELEDDGNWEEKCYGVGCQVSKEVATLWMKEIDERLFQEKDKSMRSERLSFDLLKSQSSPDARGHLPALVGPHAARHWVTGLRNMTANTNLLL